MSELDRDFWESFNEMWEELFGPKFVTGQVARPPMNFLELEDRFVAQIAVPGVSRENLQVEVRGRTLLVRGIRVDPYEEESRIYYAFEIGFGPFERRIALPEEVDISRISTTLKDGVLEIRMPKRPSRIVEIEVREG